MKKADDNIHVLYLSRFASYEELDRDQNDENNSATNDTLVMGFFDSIEEVFQQNGKGDKRVDYLSAFGIHTSASVALQNLTAKQLFTLREWKDPLMCHYSSQISTEEMAGSEAAHFGQRIFPDRDDQNPNPASLNQDYTKESLYPAFIGVVSISLNYFKETDIASIHDNLENFIRKARSAEEIPNCAGAISRSAEIRLFECTNCSDLCITISTIRLMDILLVSKAIQICTGQKSKAQFSPVWSFVAISKKAFNEPENYKNIDERAKNGKITNWFDTYINLVIDANSYRTDPWTNKSNPVNIPERESVTIDFRISIKSFAKEKEFLKKLHNAKEYEDSMKTLPVDSINRVAGVLGNGTYSVNLPFHEYLELFRFKYMHKNHFLKKKETIDRDQPVLAFLIREITGKENAEDKTETRERTVEISYQRIRFCYPKHFFERSGEPPEDTPFGTAWRKFENQISESSAIYPVRGKTCNQIENRIHRMVDLLTIYRNQIASNEYRYRDAVYLVKDLIYTYNDLFARNNIHTTIFITQLFALLRNTNLSYTMSEATEGERRNEHQIREMTENLHFASLALNRYCHEVVMNAGNNFNAQNYEIQAKVNIAKYVVAYSFFLQEICDAYRNEFQDNTIVRPEKLYPFVYLDIEQKRIQMYTLFRENRYRGKLDSPLMLAVAIPNYRSFANIYRMLPQLIHEISHRFIYENSYQEENTFLIKKGAADLAGTFARQFCRLSDDQRGLSFVQKKLEIMFMEILENHILQHIDPKLLEETSKVMLLDDILQPYTMQYCIINPAYVNRIPEFSYGIREPDYEWERIKAIINELAESLGVTICPADGFGPEEGCLYAELIFKTFYGIMLSVKEHQLQEAESGVFRLAELYADYTKEYLSFSELRDDEIVAEIDSARRRVLQGILIEKTFDRVGNETCFAVKIRNQMFADLILVLFGGGIDHFSEVCPVLSSELSEDDQLADIVSEFYMAETYRQMKGILDQNLRKWREKFKAVENAAEEFRKLEKQCCCYGRAMDLIHNQLQPVPFITITTVHSDSLNQCLANAVADLVDNYANEWQKNDKIPGMTLLLNRFSDSELTREEIDRIISVRGKTVIAEDMYSYTKIHREICADLGMCAAFEFSPFGYLVYMANLYIEHSGYEDMRMEIISREKEIFYNFRFTRYQEVVKTLVDGKKNPELVKHTINMLHQLLGELFDQLCGDKEFEQLYIDAAADSAAKDRITEIIKTIKAVCEQREGREIKLFHVDSICQSIIRQINLLGKELRMLALDRQEEKIRQKINRLSDYLRYARVIRQVYRFLQESRISDSVSLDPPEEFYRNLYQNRICNAAWVRHDPDSDEASFDCLRFRIGEYYNTCSERFNSSYDFEEQVSFILYNYQKAHQRYKDLYDMLAQPDEESESFSGDSEEFWKFADNWLDVFFNYRR